MVKTKISQLLYFFITSFLLFALSSLLFALPVSAHVLKTDGSIGGVIHIDPEDDPYVGEASGIYIELKDKEKKFSFTSCDCKVIILRRTQVLETLSLIPDQANQTSASTQYTFPTKGIYTIRIEGRPLQEQSFDKFTLSYDFRVEREKNSDSPHENPNIILPVIAGVIGVSTLLAVYNLVLSKNKN